MENLLDLLNYTPLSPEEHIEAYDRIKNKAASDFECIVYTEKTAFSHVSSIGFCVRMLKGNPAEGWMTSLNELLSTNAGSLSLLNKNAASAWDFRMRRIRQQLPTKPKSPAPVLRILVGLLAVLLLLGAAAVCLVPGLREWVQLNNTKILVNMISVVILLISLFFSWVGIVAALILVCLLKDSAEYVISGMPPFIQNWGALVAVVLIFVIVGLILLKKFRKMPDRFKINREYRAQAAPHLQPVDETLQFIDRQLKHLQELKSGVRKAERYLKSGAARRASRRIPGFRENRDQARASIKTLKPLIRKTRAFYKQRREAFLQLRKSLK